MPELPEVETVRAGLHAALAGACISDVLLRRADLRVAFPPNFAKALAGRTILRAGRRAKYLLLHLDNEQVWVAHLGMSGRFSVEAKAPARWATHDHMAAMLADGRVLIYNDARRFGLMALASADALEAHPLFAHLGPEPLEAGFNARYLKQALARRSGLIKPVLMDQALVVGVGNIYASEALFLAGIHPATPAKNAASRAATLVKCIRQVLGEAIASGGSSLRDFLHVSGEAGYFQHQFRVYGQAGKPCQRCKAPIAHMKQAGRATFFCEKCQKNR